MAAAAAQTVLLDDMIRSAAANDADDADEADDANDDAAVVVVAFHDDIADVADAVDEVPVHILDTRPNTVDADAVYYGADPPVPSC